MRGEAEAIALALEMKADRVLLDEREGRYIAQRLGLHMGDAGVLTDAKIHGLTQVASEMSVHGVLVQY